MRWMSSLSCLGLLAAISLAAVPASSVHAGIVAHWSFDAIDENGNYPDSIRNEHPATPFGKGEVLVYNGATDAPFGKAVSLLGPSHPKSFLTIPALTTIQNRSLTVAVWVNLASQNSAFVLADWPSMSESAYAFGFHPFNASRPTAQPTGNITSIETSPPGRGGGAPQRRSIISQKLPDRSIPLNEWHHVAWVWDRESESLTFYYDGTPWNEAKRSAPPMGTTYSNSLDIATNNRPVRIGSQELSVAGQQPANLTGAIDELWIFDEVLTPIQLRKLMDYNDVRGKPAPVAPAPDPGLVVPAPGPIAVAPIPNPPVSTTRPVASASTVRPEATEPTEPTTKAAKSIAGVTSPPGGLGIGRLVGIITCLLVIILMASYLTWAFVERAKLQARRA